MSFFKTHPIPNLFQQLGVPKVEEDDLASDSHTTGDLRRGAGFHEVLLLLRVSSLRLPGRETSCRSYRVHLDQPRCVHVAISVRRLTVVLADARSPSAALRVSRCPWSASSTHIHHILGVPGTIVRHLPHAFQRCCFSGVNGTVEAHFGRSTHPSVTGTFISSMKIRGQVDRHSHPQYACILLWIIFHR